MNLCKKEQMQIISKLLLMENILLKCELMPPFKNRFLPGESVADDKERYLKMAIRIDPNNPMVLYRKKEYNSFEKKSRTSKVLTKDVLSHHVVL